MRVSVLGPIRVDADVVADEAPRVVDLSERQQRVLAMLCAGDGWIGDDQLGAVLWPDNDFGFELNALHAQMTRMRRAIGNGRIKRDGAGYRLVLDRSDVDAWRLADIRPAESPDAALLAVARLWRGEPYESLREDSTRAAALRGHRNVLVDRYFAVLRELARRYLESTSRPGLQMDELVVNARRLVDAVPGGEREAVLLASLLTSSERAPEALTCLAALREQLGDRGLAPGDFVRRAEAEALLGSQGFVGHRAATAGMHPDTCRHRAAGIVVVPRPRLEARMVASGGAAHRALILVGRSGTGKTTLAHRYLAGHCVHFAKGDEPMAAFLRGDSDSSWDSSQPGLAARITAGLRGELESGGLIFDDVQSADNASFAIVASMCASASGRIVVTWNSDEDDGDGRLRALVAAGAELVEVGLFEPAEVAALAGCYDSDDSVVDLLERSGGHPFLTGLMLARSSDGQTHVDAEAATLLDRVLSLVAESRPLLDLLAVAPGALPLDVLGDAAEVGELDLAIHLDRLCDHKVVSVNGNEADLSHAMFREHLCRPLSAGTEALRCRVLAAAFERHPIEAAQRPSTVAGLWMRASESERPRAAPHHQLAFQRALASGALQDAAARFDQMSLLTRGSRPAISDARMHVLRGRLAVAQGETATAHEHFAQAYARAAHHGDALALADALIGQAGPVSLSSEPVDVAATLAGAGLGFGATLDDLGAPSRVRLLARAVSADMGRSGDAGMWAATAIELAGEPTCGPVELAVATHAEIVASLGQPGAASRVRRATRALQTNLLDEPDVEVALRLDAAAAHLELGDDEAAADEAEALARCADRTAQPIHRWWAEVLASTMQLLRGDVNGSLERSTAACELGKRLGIADASAVRALHRVAVLARTGNLATLADRWRHFDEATAPVMLAAAARACCDAYPDDALRLLDVVGDLERLPRNYLCHATAVLAGEAGTLLGHPAGSASRVLLAPWGSPRCVIGSCFGVLDLRP